MAAAGARVTGMDMAGSPLSVARLHAMEAGVEVEYLESTAEALAAERPGQYQVVTCLEMLEHVPDINSTVAACASARRTGRAAVLLHHQPQPQSLGAGGGRGGVRPRAAAPGHP